MTSLYSFEDMLTEATDHARVAKRLGRELADTRVTGSAGNGEVKVTALATGQIVDVEITDRALQFHGAGALSGLVLAAVQSAVAAAGSRRLQALEPLLGRAGSLDEVKEYVEGLKARLRTGELPDIRLPL